MARDLFKPLSEFLRLSQKEWKSRFGSKEDAEPEIRRQEAFEEGIACMESGQYEDAIPYLKKATSSSKVRKDAYYFLAECYQHVNMIPLARKTYERLMRLDYNYKDIQEKLRRLESPTPVSPAQRQPPAETHQTPEAGVTMVMPAEERYEILSTLHEGTCSRMYCAKDNLLERTIALKQVDARYPERKTYLHSMKERVKLDHTNILRIYDIDEEAGHVAMEYVDGRDLRHILRRGKLAPKMSIYMATQVVNGLHYAHAHEVLHHALTPEHLLVTRQGKLKITAFRAADSFMQRNKPHDPYKYRYMPPELFRQGTMTVACNVYSFGVILYEMFAGKPPFRLKQIKAFVKQHDPLEYDETALPPAMQPIIAHCLAMQPEQRYSTIRAVGEELLAWFKRHQREEAHEEDIAAYKDYLLMAWADGKISEQEAKFLVHKRQELRITPPEADQAERDVKQELQELLREA